MGTEQQVSVGRSGRGVLHRVGRIINYVLLACVTLVFMAPLIWALSTSLKPPDEVFSQRTQLIGSEIRWSNYVEAFRFAPFGRYLVNSLVVALVGTVIVMIVSSLGAYAFSRLRFRGRDVLFVLFLGTVMIPQEVLIVPMYWLMQRFGWVDSYPALVLPFSFGAFGTFLLRQFFLSIPEDLEEAARIDGAGAFRTFWYVALPLARPAVAVLGVFTFITFWGSYLWPLVVINDVNEKGTIPIGLAQFVGTQTARYDLMMAASLMAMIPMIAVVVILQKHLVRGVMLTGMGGR